METPTASHHRVFLCLDGMRGVAALLIVVRHTSPFFGGISFDASYLAVDLFFILSGVVIGNAYEEKLKRNMSFLAFMATRLVRLYPLYLVGLLLGLAAAAIRHVDAASLLYHGSLSLVFLPNPDRTGESFPINGPTWSLFFEILVNALYAATLGVVAGARLALVVVLSAIGLAACVVLSPTLNLDLGWTVATSIGGAFRVCFSFFAGVYLYRRIAAGGTRDGRDGNLVPWLILACVSAVLVSSPPAWAVPFFDLAAVTVVFPASIYVALRWQPTGTTAALFKLGGLTSYAVYVLHTPAGYLAGNVHHAVFRADAGSAAPWIGIVFLAGLLPACFLLDRHYDLPVRRYLTRRLIARRAPALGTAGRIAG